MDNNEWYMFVMIYMMMHIQEFLPLQYEAVVKNVASNSINNDYNGDA